MRRSSKPLGDQSSPMRKCDCACAKTMRKPARVKRDKGLSSPETCGVIRPTGKPEAPWAGAVPASNTRTRKPRCAKAQAALAPAKPLPKTKIGGDMGLWGATNFWRNNAVVGWVRVGGWPQVWWGVAPHQASRAALAPTHKLTCKRPWANTKRFRPGSRPQQAWLHSAAKG
jgi:hypothetical protein